MKNLQGVIFDWAGTTVDYGSRAPMGVFVEVFARFGVALSISDARGPMGLPKWHHIRTLLDLPHIAEAWQKAQRTPADDDAATQIYQQFVPSNIEIAAASGGLIPGTAETVAALRGHGIAIGSTTGYTRNIMARILPVAEAQGYAPDSVVCADDVPEGRPTPLMMYRCLLEMKAYPVWACVKVDDTAPGIQEGLGAGCWTVGVSLSGNGVGLSQEEVDALAPEERTRLNKGAAARLWTAGAHFVIDSVADLLPVLALIDERIERGERPIV